MKQILSNKILHLLKREKAKALFSIMALIVLCFCTSLFAQRGRIRDFGITIGTMETGPLNAITDVAGVLVGQVTLIQGDSVRTGVTAVLPHPGNIFQEKVPAGIILGNGFGKLTGYSQVEELGNIETPIVLTNTLSVPRAAEAVMDYVLSFPGNENVRSVNPVVGETNDGNLNDIRGMHVTKAHVLEAIRQAKSGPVEEGAVGAGTGTRCFRFKGGIGTASRVLPRSGYTVGVLVQTNYGGSLIIDGVPVGRELKKKDKGSPDGSCMFVIATDAPLTSRNLKRLCKRALFGFAKTGSVGSNGSGDYFIAFSTAKSNRIPYSSDSFILNRREIHNDCVTPLFQAVNEAAEEAILNSLFMAETVKDVQALPISEVLEILKKYNRLSGNK